MQRIFLKMPVKTGTLRLSRGGLYMLKSRASSWWSEVPRAPPDPILGITLAFNKDKDPRKVNVGVGAYRDNDGKPFILPSVKKACDRILEKNLDKEYAPIAGYPEFGQLAAKLAFGDDSPVISEGRNATCQGLSGTGSLRIGTAYLNSFFKGNKTVYVPKPTWSNHINICEHAGLKTEYYRYYCPKTFGLDFKGLLEDICKMKEKSVILLHACAHNPTGIDPSQEQWKEMSDVIKERKILPFFDMAYQGFASGDYDCDAFAVRHFVEHGHLILLAQSFAKNMGLYGERVGAFHLVAECKEQAENVLSQLKILIRGIYSSPPISGARIVMEILSDPCLKDEWVADLKCMSDRIKDVRKKLKENLKKAGSTHNWDHITNQIGMFCYSGLTTPQVERILKEFHVYATKDGRISMAGVTLKNVEYMAQAMHEVTK